MPTYQVTGHMAGVKTMTTNGPMWITLYRGAILPADVTEDRIRHLLDVNLITEVPDGTLAGVDAAGVAVAHGAAGPVPPGQDSDSDGEDGDDEEPDDEVNGDAATIQAAAKAKLPADGSAPDGRASKAVWVEYGVSKGYDRASLEAEEKPTIVALFKS